MISGNTEMPDAMETIFESALAFGKSGAVSISFLSLANWTMADIPAFSR